jgi:hypothetical protein
LTEIPDNKLESIPAELISDVHSENELKKVTVEGSPLVKAALNTFLDEFSDIFKATFKATLTTLNLLSWK